MKTTLDDAKIARVFREEYKCGESVEMLSRLVTFVREMYQGDAGAWKARAESAEAECALMRATDSVFLARAERWRAAAQRWQEFTCVLKNDAVAMSHRADSRTAKREQEICAGCYRVVAERIREDCRVLLQQDARPADPSKPGGGE